MNRYSLVVTLLMSSSFLFSSPAKSRDFLVNDQDFLAIQKVGRSKFIAEKAKQRAEAYRLSTKGDLPTDDILNSKRRLFYTVGDGDCFFWATGTTRREAKAVWLANSHDYFIRLKARDEIYDEFLDNRLPVQIERMPEFRPLREEYLNLRFILNQLNERTQRSQNLARLETLEMEIKAFFCREDVYRKYVEYGLGNRRNYMLFLQDFGTSNRTYFTDILAELSNKHLVVWNYSEDRKSLVKAHHHYSLNATETWEVLYDQDHYTRVAEVDNETSVREALQNEDRNLRGIQDAVKKNYKRRISASGDFLQLDKAETLAKAPHLTAAQKAKHQKKARNLKAKRKQDLKTSPLKPTHKAALYKVLIEDAKKEIEKVRVKIDLGPSKPQELHLRMYKTNAQCKRMVDEVRARAKKYPTEVLPKLRAEIAKLQRNISFYEGVLKKIGVSPSDEDIADVLLQLTLYYGELADEAEAKSENSKLSTEERMKALEVHEDAIEKKKKYGKLYEEYEEKVLNIDFQLRISQRRALERLNKYKRKNLVIAKEYLVNSDYTTAQRVVNQHFNSLRRSGVKHYNPLYLSQDPFLERDQSNIHEVYKEDISDLEWDETLPQKLYAGLLYFLVPQKDRAFVEQHIAELSHNETVTPESRIIAQSIRLGGRRINFQSEATIAKQTGGSITREDLMHAFNKLKNIFGTLSTYSSDDMRDHKLLGKKRIKRIVDTLVAVSKLEETGTQKFQEAKGAARAAIALSANEGRCVDGLQSGLDVIEDGLIQDHSSVEAEISGIIASYVNSFCQKYATLKPDEAEWTTNAPQMVKQRTFLSLPHLGEPRTSFLFLSQDIKNQGIGILSPARIMSTFLNGGNVSFTSVLGTTTRVNFEPFTAEKAISLVYEAYQRGRTKQRDGKVLTYDRIIELIHQDPYLEAQYHAFSETTPGSATRSPFFVWKGNLPEFTRKFFEHVLTRLGYIINPPKPATTKNVPVKANVPAKVKRQAQTARKPEAKRQRVSANKQSGRSDANRGSALNSSAILNTKAVTSKRKVAASRGQLKRTTTQNRKVTIQRPISKSSNRQVAVTRGHVANRPVKNLKTAHRQPVSRKTLQQKKTTHSRPVTQKQNRQVNTPRRAPVASNPIRMNKGAAASRRSVVLPRVASKRNSLRGVKATQRRPVRNKALLNKGAAASRRSVVRPKVTSKRNTLRGVKATHRRPVLRKGLHQRRSTQRRPVAKRQHRLMNTRRSPGARKSIHMNKRVAQNRASFTSRAHKRNPRVVRSQRVVKSHPRKGAQNRRAVQKNRRYARGRRG